jgi:hypothetical protein
VGENYRSEASKSIGPLINKSLPHNRFHCDGVIKAALARGAETGDAEHQRAADKTMASLPRGLAREE